MLHIRKLLEFTVTNLWFATVVIFLTKIGKIVVHIVSHKFMNVKKILKI